MYVAQLHARARSAWAGLSKSTFRNLLIICALIPLVGCPGFIILPVRRTTYHVSSASDVSAQDIRAATDVDDVTAMLGPPGTSSADARLYLYRLSATSEWDDVVESRDQQGLVVRTFDALILFVFDADQRVVQRVVHDCEERGDPLCESTPEDAMMAIEAELPGPRVSNDRPTNGRRR